MKTTFIYSLSDELGNIRYVGKTSYPIQRLSSHIRESMRSERKTHKHNWINSLILKGIKPNIEILDEVLESEWQFWEQYWICLIKSWGFNLVNSTNGGDGHNGFKASEERKQNVSKSLKEYYSNNPSKSVPRIILDKDLLYQKYIIENLSMPELSEELEVSKKTIFTNLKKCNIQKDKESWKEQLSTNPKKVVLQYDLFGNLIKEWDTLSDIKGFGNVAHCCRGELKTAGGFIWRYKDELFDLGLDNLISEKLKSVNQYDLSGNYIKTYKSIAEAEKVTNINIQIKNKSSGGFTWKYSEDKSPIEYKNNKIKLVIQYDLLGNKIKEFNSIAEAAKLTNSNSSRISACCNNKIKSSNNYIWKYKETFVDKYVNNKHNKKTINQYDLLNNYIKTYNSISEAERENNINNINHCLSGKRKTAGGYKWKYA
jgi:hypothetical protein